MFKNQQRKQIKQLEKRCDKIYILGQNCQKLAIFLNASLIEKLFSLNLNLNSCINFFYFNIKAIIIHKGFREFIIVWCGDIVRFKSVAPEQFKVVPRASIFQTN